MVTRDLPLLAVVATGGMVGVAARHLIVTRQPVIALLYLAATVIGALVAVWVAATATRRFFTWRLQ